MNLDLPLDATADELDDVLADLDRALDADFLREVDEALERIAGGPDLGAAAAARDLAG